jgi:CHAD domain-containing protein
MRLDLAAWLNEREWRQQPVTESSARLMRKAGALAETILDKAHRKLKKRGQGVELMNADERHKLRIQVKKVRYASEFFASLFPRKKADRYLEALRSLQDELGRMHDLEVARDLISTLLTGDHERDLKIARAGGLVMGWHAHGGRARSDTLGERWTRFLDAKPFWR